MLLNAQSLNNILKYPHENGFLNFTLGILLILTIYHLLLFFQHRDKIYLFYGFYTFFIILAHLIFAKDGFLYDLLKPVEWVKNYRVQYVEIYYIIYFFFAMRFLQVKSEFPKWANYCYKGTYLLIGLCVFFFVTFLLSNSIEINEWGYNFVFVPLMTIISVVVYILFFKLKNKLRYYIIFGGLTLSICSYISLFQFFRLIDEGSDIQSAFGILYVGFILENVMFSLGLGHKQKIILDQRDESQKSLIDELQKNEELQKEVEQKLQKDIEVLNKQAEIERLERQQASYGKEMAELKISALRSQMNPHFIFNSLNSIKRYIIDNEKENAVYYLNKFSKLIRKVLATTREKEISLSDELETMELYVNIENIRFNNQIDFSIDVENGLQINTIKVPSLILQPFLENAIWHGLSLKEGEKKLEIKIKKNGRNHIQIEVMDNGIGRKRSAEIKKKKIHQPDSIGIKLTEERLKNFAHDYKSGHALVFSDLEDSKLNNTGTKVTLKIPLK